jgi:hypothetical protein
VERGDGVGEAARAGLVLADAAGVGEAMIGDTVGNALVDAMPKDGVTVGLALPGVGETVGLEEAAPGAGEIVGSGDEAPGVGDVVGLAVGLGVGETVGLGVGVGQGGTISFQTCSSAATPPISSSSSLHFWCHRVRSGGPGVSAVPGKMR